MRMLSYSHTEAGIRERARLAGREFPAPKPRFVPVIVASTPEPELAKAEPTVDPEIQKFARRGMPRWVRDIVVELAHERGVDIAALAGHSRNRRVVEVRGEALYRIKTGTSPITGLSPSYPQIANWFGREHTGVLYSVAKHAMIHGLPLKTKHDVQKQIDRRRKAAAARSERIKAERAATSPEQKP